MDIISSIGQAIDLAKRLREISKNIAEAEFKNLLADLSSGLLGEWWDSFLLSLFPRF